MKLKTQEIPANAPPKPDIKEFVTVEDTGTNLKTLMINVPSEVVIIQFNVALKSVSEHAVLPGFRKGRVPNRLLERKFGDMIRRETRVTLLNNMTTEAIEEFGLRVIGEPRAKNFDDIEIEPGKSVHFEVELEVVPEFDLPDFESLEVMRPSLELPEGIIDDEVNKLCVNEGSLEERDAPEPGDYLTGHGIMLDQDGTEHYNIDGAVVRVPEKSDEGKGMILGVAVDDFAKQLGSPKSGDSVSVKVKGPEHHEVEDIRGKDLTVSFEVQRIDRIIPAELADVVAKLGLASEGQLREIIQQRLEENTQTQQDSAMQSQVVRFLIENTEFSLPSKLTETQAARNLERRRMDLMYQGVSPQEIEQNLAEMRAASSESAIRELKMYFILGTAAEKHEVKFSATDVNEHIAKMAVQHGVTPDALRKQLVDADKLNAIRAQVREHMTIKMILEKATIKDVSADVYNEYVRGLNEAN